MLDPIGQRILTINTGSSSLKVALYDVAAGETRLLSGEFERIGRSGGSWRFEDAGGAALIERQVDLPDQRAALDTALAWLHAERPDLRFDAVGHRVVHGGITCREPKWVNADLIAALQDLVALAPNHMPQAVAAIQAVSRTYPALPQVACFDTAFHRRMPPVAQIYPLPRSYTDAGVIRYGFHGLSYEYVMHALQTLAPKEAEGRVIIAHLGNGASMAAVREGVGVDTTMGFTPAGGLMMGTRCGDIDPGVLLYLVAERKMTPASLNELVNRQAGLLGVSGMSADMRDLLQREAANDSAAEAVALFCYQARKHLGAMIAALGGVDILVFTGGIGEHAAAVRARIVEGFGFLGIRLDPDQNEVHAAVISRPESTITVRVMKTDEDRMIARHVRNLLERPR